MQSAQIDMEELEKKTLDILNTYGKPVSVGYVAYNLKVCWATARALLFRMSLTGKIKALDTSKGFLFELKN